MPASAAAADSATTHRAAAFMQRELGPLGPIFRAIGKMPEKSAADVRAKEEALDAAQELSMRHFRQLLVPHGSASTVSANRVVDEHADIAGVVVKGHRPFPYQVDGDYLGEVTQLRFRYERDCISLVLP